jgi:hypothetical protein
VVTGAGWPLWLLPLGPGWLLWLLCLLWLVLELDPPSLDPSSFDPLSLDPSSLCVDPESVCVDPEPLCVDPPSSLCELLAPPAAPGVVVAPPLPSAATASQAATKVASAPAVTRRRMVRRRCEAGGFMPRVVADEAWIFLGIRSAPGKTPRLRQRDRRAATRHVTARGQGESNVTY